MPSARLVGLLVVCSVAWSVSAQTTTQAPKPAPKPPAASKPAPKPDPAKAPASAPAPAPAAKPAPPKDLTIKTKYTTGGQVSENTTYIKDTRQRVEFPGVTMITQCDLKRTVQINDTSKHYLVTSTAAAAAPTPAPPPDPPAPSAPSGGFGRGGGPKPQGVVVETVALTDTGERKPMFGFEARHIQTVVTHQPGPNACDKRTTKIETDGWYTDLPEHASCPVAAAPPPPPPTQAQACSDRIETHTSGEGTLGFVLASTVTTTTGEEKDKEKDITTVSIEVSDLTVSHLSAALFDVPKDYTEVKTYPELLPTVAGGAPMSSVLFGSLTDGTTTLAPKKAGTIRVGIVDPVDKSGRSLSTPMLSGMVMGPLNKKPFEAVPLSGSTAADLTHDAQQKDCDYILAAELTSLTTTKANKVGGVLKKVSGDTNSGDEVNEARVDYKLFAVNDPAKPRLTSATKSSSGGFGVSSALRVAAFAGTMYMTMGMGMGFMGQAGALGLGGMGGMGGGMGGMMNPGMNAAMSIMQGAQTSMPGMGGGGTDKVIQTAQDALSKAAEAAADEMKKTPKTVK